MQFPRKKRRSPVINIINLIDVLVVLLIFYIATTVFKKSQPNVNIKIPSSTQATTTQQTPPSVIYITADGKFFLDDTPVEADQLGQLLKDKKTANPDFKAAVKADTNTPLGMFIKVYDAANFAGITDLQMFMNPLKSSEAPGTMIREIVHYDAPILRAKGKPVSSITKEIEALVTDLFDTMRAARGVGLASQQIGVALQVAVIDVTGIKERPSKMWIAGKPVDPEAHMPIILINPVLKPTKKKEISHEGCLSFPGLTLDIPRSQRVGVKTLQMDGSTLEFDAGGLLARAVLHETDHLHGRLFIDDLSVEDRRLIREDLEYIKRGEPIPEEPDDNES